MDYSCRCFASNRRINKSLVEPSQDTLPAIHPWKSRGLQNDSVGILKLCDWSAVLLGLVEKIYCANQYLVFKELKKVFLKHFDVSICIYSARDFSVITEDVRTNQHLTAHCYPNGQLWRKGFTLPNSMRIL